MHAKEKGNLGELVAMKHLLGNGYPVFTEFGDNAKIDLIAIVDKKPVTIQVKTRHSIDGAKVEVDTRKCGPNYEYRYTEEDVDIFAVYIYDLDILFFVATKELLINGRVTVFRVTPAKNGMKKNVHMVDNYLSFKKALRGHTQDTQTGKAVGEEMVQATTA